MFAHGIEKSKIGDYGFNTLNFYTNDNIYFSGFMPNEKEVETLGRFVREINLIFFSSDPSKIYINKIEGSFNGSIKTSSADGFFTAEGEGKTIAELTQDLKKNLLMSPTSDY